MPETPDFAQIARLLAIDAGYGSHERELVQRIAEQLRLTWNAALDAVTTTAEERLGRGDAWTRQTLQSVVKDLRRA